MRTRLISALASMICVTFSTLACVDEESALNKNGESDTEEVATASDDSTLGPTDSEALHSESDSVAQDDLDAGLECDEGLIAIEGECMDCWQASDEIYNALVAIAKVHDQCQTSDDCKFVAPDTCIGGFQPAIAVAEEVAFRDDVDAKNASICEESGYSDLCGVDFDFFYETITCVDNKCFPSSE